MTIDPSLTAYDDRFVTISTIPPMLTLKHYRVFKSTVDVPISSLLYIRPASDVVKRIGLRSQGFSLRGIVWARDQHRGNTFTGPRSGHRDSFIIKSQGDKLRRGFSVEDSERFLAILEQIRPGLTRMAMGEQEETEIKNETERELSGSSEDKDSPKSFFEL